MSARLSPASQLTNYEMGLILSIHTSQCPHSYRKHTELSVCVTYQTSGAELCGCIAAVIAAELPFMIFHDFFLLPRFVWRFFGLRGGGWGRGEVQGNLFCPYVVFKDICAFLNHLYTKICILSVLHEEDTLVTFGFKKIQIPLKVIHVLSVRVVVCSGAV